MIHKVVFIDTETTGLDPKVNGIIQVAGIIAELDSISGDINEQERFDFKCQPMIGDAVEQSALKVNGVTMEQLKTFDTGRNVYNEFCKLLSKRVSKFDKKDKYFFIAYNAQFDYNMLYAWFEKNHDKFFGSWFFSPAIDVMTLAGSGLMDSRDEMKNFKLGTVAERLGLSAEGDLHDAFVDIILTKDVFQTIYKKYLRGIKL
jgi:DNA polymerase-3 subunit epsilon